MGKLSAKDIEQWIDNDEGLYKWWKRSGHSRRRFIRDNRSSLEAAIGNVLSGKNPAHYLAYERGENAR